MKRVLVASLVSLTLAACGAKASSSSSTTPGPAGAQSQKRLVNVDAEGVGLGGYDPVAYQTFGKPVTGVPEHAVQYEGATYRLSSSVHRAGFEGPTHAPLYGGFCAYAASLGNLSPADPLAFAIHDGHLLVFTNEEYRDLFMQDPAGNKAKADASWPRLVATHGK